MKASSRKGAGGIGVPDRVPSPAMNPAVSTEAACRYTRDLSRTSADSALALFAFTANQALTQQINAAHRFGQAALEQSNNLEETARRRFPAGPLRDSLRLTARIQANAGNTLVAIADAWGRRFGHLAFAFALPDRRE